VADIKKNSALKKIVILLLVTASLLVVAVLFLFKNISTTGDALDRSSHEYVDEAVPAISKEWSVDEMKKRASEEFLATMSKEELVEFFGYVRENLGNMTVYKTAEGEAKIMYMNSKKNVSAYYVAEAVFEKGPAHIQVSLIQRNDKWQILGYRVNSDVFKPY
jgi:hypothetical protein